jgi:hypothetical protein
MALMVAVISVTAAWRVAAGSFWVQVHGWVGERRVAWEAAE